MSEKKAKPKRRWGDRENALLVRDMDSLHKVMPHIYVGRTNSEVYISEEFDVTDMLEYIREYNAAHPEGKMTFFHAILAGFSRIIYHRPLLNRFIKGRKIYEREKISLSFMIKKVFEDTSEEAMMLLDVEPDMTLPKISEKLQQSVKSARGGSTTSTDAVVDFLAKLPWIFIVMFTSLLRFLDYFLILPKSVSTGDINYSTAIVTNLGSIKCGSVYHHLSNWGTCSIIIAIGTIHKRPVYDCDGNCKLRDFVDIGVTADERIGDGFYFSKSITMLRKILADPKVLEQAIKEALPYEF